MSTPANCLLMERMGLSADYISSVTGLRGGIPNGCCWTGYTIGCKMIRRVRQDHARFIRKYHPSEIYVKRKVREFLKHSKVVVSFSEPYALRVNYEPV